MCVPRPVTSYPHYCKDPCVAELHEVATNKAPAITAEQEWDQWLNWVLWYGCSILTAKINELIVDTSLDAEYSIQLQMLYTTNWIILDRMMCVVIRM